MAFPAHVSRETAAHTSQEKMQLTLLDNISYVCPRKNLNGGREQRINSNT